MKLVDARKKARYTQQQVADHLGISRPTYANMEANPGTVSIDDAFKIAGLFSMDVGEIFFESDYK